MLILKGITIEYLYEMLPRYQIHKTLFAKDIILEKNRRVQVDPDSNVEKLHTALATSNTDNAFSTRLTGN